MDARSRIKLRSSAGFSLVELMVTVGIVSLMATVIFELLLSQQRSANNIQFRVAADVLAEEIRGTLSSMPACRNSLSGKFVNLANPLALIPVTSIKNSGPPPGDDVYVVGAKYNNNNVLLNAMNLTAFVDDGLPGKGTILVRSEMQAIREGYGTQIFPRDVKVSVEFDVGTGAITNCIAQSKTSDVIWRRDATSLNNIYYNLGNVGIGTSNPSDRLHIVGGEAPGIILGAGAGPTSDTTFQFVTDKGETNYLAQGDGEKGWQIGARGNSFTVNPVEQNNFYFGYWDGSSWQSSILYLQNTGRIGIGNNNPQYKLDVSGDINSSGVVHMSGIALSSDRRFKRNFTPLNQALEQVLLLQGVSYDWRTDEFPDRKFSSRRQFGLIAQDVEKVLPEIVGEDTKGYKSVNYVALIAPVIEAIKALYVRILGQEARTEAAAREIASLRSENAELKNENRAIKSWICSKDPAAPVCE
jgi:prepilin-type N-terminal cleavage/methylation domain-containing protein